MRRICLFAEDYGHQAFFTSFLTRIFRENGIAHEIIPHNVRGGHGRAVSEYTLYLRDLKRGRTPLPDLIVVAIDSNCKGLQSKRLEIEEKTDDALKQLVVPAIPDPHIERWMLMDSSAFKKVFGKGCSAPDNKCDRSRYKNVLIEEISESGITPLLGGMEFAEDIVKFLSIEQLKKDVSFYQFYKKLKARIVNWEAR